MADYREIAQDYGQGAIKATILINGGAAVALLSQIAELNYLSGGRYAMMAWAVGVFLAAFAWPSGFFSTRYVDKSERETAKSDRHLRTANIWMWIALLAVFLSLIAFLAGCFMLADGLEQSAKAAAS